LLVVIRREEQRNSTLFMRSLQASVARQRAILQSMVDALIMIDAHGRIHHVNSAATKLFGYEPSELIGQNVKILMPEPFLGEHDGYIRNYINTGESKIIGKGREVMGKRKDGSVFPALLTIGESLEGDERMFVGILHDMTAYNEAQRKIVAQAGEIQRSHQELDRIGQVASTALQSPLQRIASLGEAINAREAAGLQGNEKEQLRSLTDQARDASRLVQGLVDYTRAAETGHGEPIDLEQVVRDVERDLASRLRAAAARLQVDVAGTVVCDRKQVHQLFWNLIDNALKFADPSRTPEIRITASPADETTGLTIVVADNGIGMPAESVDRVFDAFYRVDPQHRAAGAGLGLSFCRKIVDAAGGSISASSELGKGSRVVINLPMAGD
jgi:two-component system sensor kinase FixL